MSEEKQIEEMKQIEVLAEDILQEYTNCYSEVDKEVLAKMIYNADFRKQIDGEWLPSPDGINPIRCNKCNMPAPFAFLEDDFGEGFYRYPWHYCPNCGAKMKGGAE